MRLCSQHAVAESLATTLHVRLERAFNPAPLGGALMSPYPDSPHPGSGLLTPVVADGGGGVAFASPLPWEPSGADAGPVVAHHPLNQGPGPSLRSPALPSPRAGTAGASQGLGAEPSGGAVGRATEMGGGGAGGVGATQRMEAEMAAVQLALGKSLIQVRGVQGEGDTPCALYATLWWALAALAGRCGAHVL